MKISQNNSQLYNYNSKNKADNQYKNEANPSFGKFTRDFEMLIMKQSDTDDVFGDLCYLRLHDLYIHCQDSAIKIFKKIGQDSSKTTLHEDQCSFPATSLVDSIKQIAKKLKAYDETNTDFSVDKGFFENKIKAAKIGIEKTKKADKKAELQENINFYQAKLDRIAEIAKNPTNLFENPKTLTLDNSEFFN